MAPPKRARSTTKRALPARAPLHIHARQRRNNKRNDDSDHSGDEDGDGDEEQLSGGEDEGDDDTGEYESPGAKPNEDDTAGAQLTKDDPTKEKPSGAKPIEDDRRGAKPIEDDRRGARPTEDDKDESSGAKPTEDILDDPIEYQPTPHHTPCKVKPRKTHGPSLSSRNADDLQGASRTVGGFSQGRALGNQPNHADNHADADVLMEDFRAPIIGKVLIYMDRTEGSQPTMSVKHDVTTPLSDVLKKVGRSFSPIRRKFNSQFCSNFTKY